ncbi:MAG: carboxylating nicotinate-nucleotide diphosphorylase [Candidatus Acidiferrales bacterium]
MSKLTGMAAHSPIRTARPTTRLTREHRVEQAFFRGSTLTLDNPVYETAVRQLVEPLLHQDLGGGDLTSSALGLTATPASTSVLAREDGVIAGLAEFAMLYGEHGVGVTLEKTDGDVVQSGEVVLRARGNQGDLLALERTGLNLLQRMSGIATAARRIQNLVLHTGSTTRIVGTRKTPWGLLDKRALHLAGVGTHRLGLGDAILIKNNHLALVANSEEEAAPKAIEKAWSLRAKSAFIEVEVRGERAARAAAGAFRRLQELSLEDFPCVLMLDNMSPDGIRGIVDALQHDGVWDAILVEASGGISESNMGEYAACGADVISIGALTHSARALDLSQRIV